MKLVPCRVTGELIAPDVMPADIFIFHKQKPSLTEEISGCEGHQKEWRPPKAMPFLLTLTMTVLWNF